MPAWRIFRQQDRDIISQFMWQLIVWFAFMFSPSVPSFFVKFAESVFEPQAFSLSGVHEPCQIHHHPSPSASPSIAPILSVNSRARKYKHMSAASRCACSLYSSINPVTAIITSLKNAPTCDECTHGYIYIVAKKYSSDLVRRRAGPSSGVLLCFKSYLSW